MIETPDGSAFAGSYIKLRRAQKHLAELRSVIDAFFGTVDPGWKVNVTDLPNGKKNIAFEFMSFPGPEECGAIVGDIFHNLRTGLDLMATRLVELNNKDPKNSYFPFSNDLDSLPKQIKNKNFHLAGEEAVKILTALAPYKGGNAALRAIHDFDIQDKHKTLILTDISWLGPSIRFRTWEIEGKGTGEFLFPKDGPFGGEALIPTLEGLVQLTHRTVEAFAVIRRD